jgi:hypothetical protein
MPDPPSSKAKEYAAVTPHRSAASCPRQPQRSLPRRKRSPEEEKKRGVVDLAQLGRIPGIPVVDDPGACGLEPADGSRSASVRKEAGFHLSESSLRPTIPSTIRAESERKEPRSLDTPGGEAFFGRPENP